jgi:hypothetical protein
MLSLIRLNILIFLVGLGIWYSWSVVEFTAAINTMNWEGSLMYLPHGVRVLGIVFFGLRVFPGLLAAEIFGPYLIEPEHYFDEWFIGGVVSILCVAASVRLLEWVNVDNETSFFRPLNFTNYRFLLLTVILSALFNAIGSNLVVQFFVPEITVEPDNILRFFIGDTLGSIVFFLFLSFLFTTLADLKLVRRYKNGTNIVDIDK